MAFTAAGKYMMNPQRAAHADKMSAMGAKPMAKPFEKPESKMAKGTGEKMGAGSSTLNCHDDGTCSTDHNDGEPPMEHASMKDALSHMAEKHGHHELAEHIAGHDDNENDPNDQSEDEMPMPPSHGHMLAGL